MTASGIDVPAARRRFERSASTYGEVAVLAREVERRMAERLDYMRHDPRWVLDAGCGPGEGLGLLRERYPKAGLIGLDNFLSLLGADTIRAYRLLRCLPEADKKPFRVILDIG